MALDSFLISGSPFLLNQRESRAVETSLERGALERCDRIVTVSMNERYGTNENDRFLGISHFFSVKPFTKHSRQDNNSGRFAMTRAQEDDIRKWFILECLRKYSKVREY